MLIANGPGIATVADLRASSLSTVIKPKRGSEPEIASEPAIVAIPCWRLAFIPIFSSVPFILTVTLYFYKLFTI
jgi:hypothetical protein